MAPTPEQLRRLALALRARRETALRVAEARTEALLREAEAYEAEAQELEAAAAGPRKRLRTFVHSSTNGRMGEPTKDEARPRRGAKLRTAGPLAIAAENSGKSLFEIAAAFDTAYSTVKSWNARRAAPDAVKKRLAEPPFSVPASAWTQ